jgi:hypothetical protein
MTLYAGRWIAQHGIPHQEVFTVAASGRGWIDQQWLAELTDYEAWRIGGWPGVALLSVAMIGFAYAVLAALMLRRGASVILAVCCSAIAIVVALSGMFIRSQLLALPLFALLLAWCLTDAEDDLPRRRLVLVLPLLVLWANVHGSVLMGAGLAAAYLAYRAVLMARSRLWRRAAGCGVLASVALLTPLATPYGIQIVHYYSELLGNGAIAAASPEWRAPTGLSLLLFAAPLALVLVSVIAQLIKRGRPSLVLVAATAATALATAMASRNEVWFAMAAALLISDTARTWLPTKAPSRALALGMSAAAIGLATLGVVVLTTRSNAQYESLTPLRAIDATAVYASQHICVRILADNDGASALLWHDPALAGRVAFDARLEQYPARALDRWITFQLANGSGWLSTTRGYQLFIGSTIYNPSLAHRLAHLPASTVLARDSHGIAVVRNGSSSPACTAHVTGSTGA